MKVGFVRITLIVTVFFMETIMAERKNYTEEEDRLKERYVNEIVNEFEVEMQEKFGLMCKGMGGSMPYDIKLIGVRFFVDRKITIDEARELEVRSTERLVEMVNACEKIRPFLIQYPWTHNGVEIAISSLKKDGSCYEDGVSFIFQAKGKLFYYGQREENSLGDEINEETYEEAKQIVDDGPSCLKPIEKKKGWLSWLGF